MHIIGETENMMNIASLRAGNEKQKIFKDATQGYIQIPNNMVKNLIDIFEVQRLKDVAQTGIRPIYSGATHDRFSHSIGVYNIGVSIYAGFRKNLLADFSGTEYELKKAEELLDKYEPYYYTACFLHDIGHPALSHTFEYLYDNKYLLLDDKTIEINAEEVQRLRSLSAASAGKKPRLESELIEQLNRMSNNTVLTDSIHASQHEMMGAYQILHGSPAVQNTVGGLFAHLFPNFEESDKLAAYAFIACMIIGAQYSLPPVTEEDVRRHTSAYQERFDRSLKNCIVRLLNGLIDADSIDYLNRNSHFAGYSTVNLDIIRLCNAFSAHYDSERLLFEPCLEKSAMSALEGFINARHFEPRWLYSHHKIIYYDTFLAKYLYKKCSRYMYAMDREKWVNAILEAFKTTPEIQEKLLKPYSLDAPPAASGADWRTNVQAFIDLCTENGFEQHGTAFMKNLAIPDFLCGYFVEALRQETETLRAGADPAAVAERVRKFGTVARIWTTLHQNIREAYRAYLVSPVGRFKSDAAHTWHKSSDSDINALFKQIYLHYKDINWDDLSPVEKEVNDQYSLFKDALEEFHNRQYRQSLWKTSQEYYLFLAEIQARTGLSREAINDIFVKFIVTHGFREEFDDPREFGKEDPRNYNAVYLNYTKDALLGPRSQQFDDMFSRFGLGMVICIYSYHYKDFSKLKIRFKTGSGVRLIPYSELSEGKPKQNEYLPYIYYKRESDAGDGESDAEYAARLRDELAESLIAYISKTYGGTTMPTGNYYAEQGKIIRDPVHGDIFVPERFLKVIDSKAFQRLRRIKQLATADYVFPEACHTRFAHSLGTFHIMTLMLTRICSLFDYLHITYTSEEKDAALMAALLHDVGHGPYSHAFEALSSSGKTHEDWTYEIIQRDPELQNLFDTYFHKDFSTRVVDCLRNTTHGASDQNTLQYVFSALISSQLDADRLDYLMRDSFNTGVKLGIIDLQKIISSLELTQYNGKLAVCIAEDALPSIEQLIVGRFNMYDTVYFAPYKAFSEQLLINIVKRISKDADLSPDSRLHKILNDSLTLHEYIELDDSVFQSEIYQYRNTCTDPITREMIDSFFNRCGYERLRIMDESTAANNSFIVELEKELGVRVDELAGVVYRAENYTAYKYSAKSNGAKDAILIVGRNGVVSDLFQKSKIIGHSWKDSTSGGNEYFWKAVRSCIYVNYKVLKMERDYGGNPLDPNKVKALVDAHSLRRHTEIEEKYSCSEDVIAAGRQTDKLFHGQLAQYSLSGDIQLKQQEDTYYDTDDFFLGKNNCSFRCRKLGDKIYIFTVKKSIDPNNGENGGQFIRSEFEQESESATLDDQIAAFLKKHLSELFSQQDRMWDVNSLQAKIIVKNNRVSYNVVRTDSNFKCEVSLDSVTYVYGREEKADWQVELELKSQDAIHRVELKEFAKKFGESLGINMEMRETLSKYGKALQVFGLIP